MRSLSYSESHNPLLANEEKWDDEEDDEDEDEEQQLQQHGRRGGGGGVGGSDEEDTGVLNMIGILDRNQFYTSAAPAASTFSPPYPHPSPILPHSSSAPSLAEWKGSSVTRGDRRAIRGDGGVGAGPGGGAQSWHQTDRDHVKTGRSLPAYYSAAQCLICSTGPGGRIPQARFNHIYE